MDANDAFVELVTSRDAFIRGELAEMLQVESFDRYFKQLEERYEDDERGPQLTPAPLSSKLVCKLADVTRKQAERVSYYRKIIQLYIETNVQKSLEMWRLFEENQKLKKANSDLTETINGQRLKHEKIRRRRAEFLAAKLEVKQRDDTNVVKKLSERLEKLSTELLDVKGEALQLEKTLQDLEAEFI